MINELVTASLCVDDRIDYIENKLIELSLYLQGDPESETAKRTMKLYDAYDAELVRCKKAKSYIENTINDFLS